MESLEEFLKADHQMTHLTKESTQPASLLALKMLKTSLKNHGLTSPPTGSPRPHTDSLGNEVAIQNSKPHSK